MYESYPWPGAHQLKVDTKLLSNWVKELFDGVLKEIKLKKVQPVGK